jgi:hypothetical protein
VDGLAWEQCGSKENTYIATLRDEERYHAVTMDSVLPFFMDAGRTRVKSEGLDVLSILLGPTTAIFKWTTAFLGVFLPFSVSLKAIFELNVCVSGYKENWSAGSTFAPPNSIRQAWIQWGERESPDSKLGLLILPGPQINPGSQLNLSP